MGLMAICGVRRNELFLFLAGYSGFEAGARRELGHSGGRNLDRRASLRVLAAAGRTLG